MLLTDDVVDFVIQDASDAGLELSLRKLHYLLYYIQAWYLANYSVPMFSDKFQAGVFGPLSENLLERFKDKTYYCVIASKNIRPESKGECFTLNQVELIGTVLEEYGALATDQIGRMIKQERPWMEAREGLNPITKSVRHIKESTMKVLYQDRL